MPPSSPQSGVKSAMRTLDLLEYVVARPSGVVAQEIAMVLGIPISSLSYLLATLVERGYLRRDGRRHFAGAGLNRLRRPLSDLSLADLARPLVKALKQQVNETTSLFIKAGWEMEAVLTETSSQTLRYAIEAGTRTPMHCVSAGKAFLASLAPDDLAAYFAEAKIERFTDFTVHDPRRLAEELATVRQTGLAFTRDEYTMGIAGVGVAIIVDGKPIAGLSVGAPTPRISAETKAQICGHLVKTARALAAAATEKHIAASQT